MSPYKSIRSRAPRVACGHELGKTSVSPRLGQRSEEEAGRAFRFEDDGQTCPSWAVTLPAAPSTDLAVLRGGACR